MGNFGRFSTKKKTKKPVNKKSKPKSIVQSEEVQAELDNLEPHSTQKPVSKKDALIKAAKEVEREFVPSGATLESELVAYRKQWNKMISKQANSDLTEDVNALIRDYMRKVLRTLSSKSFTADRIRDLAATLADTPNMKKISEPQALLKYIELYMVYLVKNM